MTEASVALQEAFAGDVPGFTDARWHVLAAAGDDGAAMSELAAATGMPAASVTRLIDEMVDENLVHRRADEFDRRRVLVFRTARGLREYRRIRSAVSRSDLLAALLADAQGPVARSRAILDELCPPSAH